MYVWPPQATDVTEPEIITEDIDDIRFTEDGQILVLAFIPEGAEPTLPPSLPALAESSRNDAPIDGRRRSRGDAPEGEARRRRFPSPTTRPRSPPEDTTTTEPGDG